MCIALKEADEKAYWLELLCESHYIGKEVDGPGGKDATVTGHQGCV